MVTPLGNMVLNPGTSGNVAIHRTLSYTANYNLLLSSLVSCISPDSSAAVPAFSGTIAELCVAPTKVAALEKLRERVVNQLGIVADADG
jgi:hypothetical protein